MTTSMGPLSAPTPPARPSSAAHAHDESPGSLIVGGAAVAIIGLVLLFTPAVASVTVTFFAGWCLMIGGVVLAVAAVAGRERGGMISGAALGVLLFAGGVLLSTNVLKGTMTLTAVLIALLLVDGVVSIVAAIATRGSGWAVALLSGVLSLALGSLLWAGWPSTATWLLGFYAGVIVLFHGLTLVSAGMLLRSSDRPTKRISRP